jgi:hypothetical protein
MADLILDWGAGLPFYLLSDGGGSGKVCSLRLTLVLVTVDINRTMIE